MSRTFLVLALFSTTLFAQTETAKPEWHADYDKAVAAAKSAGKDLLVDFTGSDWCGWCIRLKKEVFDEASFVEAASKDFIFVALDFPNGEEAKAKVPNPKRNQELMEAHGIQGFPTILLINADGVVYGRTGYRPGGPKPYLEHLAELKTKGKAALAALAEIEAAIASATDEAGKTAARMKAVKALAGMDSEAPGVARMAALVKEAMPALQGEDRLTAVKGLVNTGHADAAVLEEARKLDPKNEHGLLEALAFAAMSKVSDDDSARAFLKELDGLMEIEPKNKDQYIMMVFNATRWSFEPLADKEGAKKYATRLKAIASDNENMMELVKKVLEGE